MVFFCWILGILFFYSIQSVNLKQMPQRGQCGDEDFFSFEFKDGDTCIKNKSVSNQMLIMFYYMTTTMSTVGFGDFRPTSTFERGLIIPCLLYGYLFFSFSLSETQSITSSLGNSMNSQYDLSGVNQFIDTLISKYNQGKPNKKLEEQIYDYFSFYWDNHRTHFLVSYED